MAYICMIGLFKFEVLRESSWGLRKTPATQKLWERQAENVFVIGEKTIEKR